MTNILLFPVSLIYGFVIYIRNFLFDIKIIKPVAFSQATICVGNLTVGGTGKTPHVEYLVNLLSSTYKTATLSRGYKRKTSGFLLATENSNATHLGDEPFQIYSKFPNITVAVDEKRVRGVKKILEKNPDTDVIILDDAYQHRYIKPGYNILLTDFNNLISHDHFLPYGRLRDSISQKHRADIVIVTKCPKTLKPIEQGIIYKDLKLFPYQKVFFTTFNYGSIRPVFEDFKSEQDTFVKPAVMALAGIANPTLFFDYLNSEFTVTTAISLPDHYHFTEKKINAIFEAFSKIAEKDKIIVTTEKDASRLKTYSNLPKEIKDCFYYLPIKVEFLNNQAEEFNNKIQTYVRKSKRNNGLYSK